MLSKIYTPHSGSINVSRNGGVLFTEGVASDFQICRCDVPESQHKRITISMQFRVLLVNGNVRTFYVNGWGGIVLLEVSNLGVVHVNPDFLVTYDIKKKDDYFNLTFTYNSNHPSISFGLMSDKKMVYAGDDKFPSLEILRLELLSIEAKHGLSLPFDFVLADVGASGGLQSNWDVYVGEGGGVSPVLFEPFKDEAKYLQNRYPNSVVVEKGLANKNESMVLYQTKVLGCSSVLFPDKDALKRWDIASWFDVIAQHEISCARYDTLHQNGEVPVPHFVKIDVQGFEYEVLSGFGDVLHQVLGIELESHFYQLYHGQKLFHDIVDLLSRYGFTLNALRPQMNFGRDLVEVNAYFTKAENLMRDTLDVERLDFIRKMFNL